MSPDLVEIIEVLAENGQALAIKLICETFRKQQARAAEEAERKRVAARPAAAARKQKSRANLKRCSGTADMLELDDEQRYIDAAVAQEMSRPEPASQPSQRDVSAHKKKESFLSVKESDSDSKNKYNSRATLCPPDWQPKEIHYDEARAIGHGRDKVDQLAREMRLWSQANRHRDCARKSNWDAAFSQWIHRQKPGLTVIQGGKPAIDPNGYLAQWARENDIDLATWRKTDDGGRKRQEVDGGGVGTRPARDLGSDRAAI